MAEVVTATKPQKRPLGDENAGGADAPDASKKLRVAAAEAPTAQLTKEVKEAAKAFRKHANKHAPGWEAQEGENTAELVERVVDETESGINLIARPVVRELDSKYQKKWKKAKLLNAIKKYLASVSAAAFVAAGAPPKKKEEEGYVAGIIDIRSVKGDGEWLRYDNPNRISKDTGFLGESGPSQQQISEMFKRLSDPKSQYAERRGFKVRYVTPATRHATATNKVVRGFHAEDKAPRKQRARERHATAVAVAEEEEKAKVADAARDKEKREVDYVIRCAEFGLAVVAAPPLPDGATDADRERLEDAALEALYGD